MKSNYGILLQIYRYNMIDVDCKDKITIIGM